MTNKQSTSKAKDGAPKPGRSAKAAVPIGRGRRIRVEATRRKTVDPEMIALCYWLIAQRIVAAAEDSAEGASAPAAPAPDESPAIAGPTAEGSR
jgi:hypothetical protein